MGGWAYEAGSKAVSCGLAGCEPASVKMFAGGSVFTRGVVGGEKREEKSEGETRTWETVVSSEGGHVPGHIPRRKDISKSLASIMLHFAETSNQSARIWVFRRYAGCYPIPTSPDRHRPN